MTTITALPTPPSRDDPDNFISRGDAFMAALPAFVTETNTVAGEVNTNASNAASSASTASTHAGTATTKASEAAASAAAAAASATTALNAPGTSATSTTSLAVGTGSQSLTIQTGKALVAGMPVLIADTAAPTTNWMWGQVSSYDSGTGALVVAATVTGGSGTKTAWTVSLSANPSSGSSSLTRSARTGNTILGTADKGTLIDVTSGTFTQTFSAAGTLGDGWYCWYANSGSGVVSLDSPLSKDMYPGDMRLLQCDGTTLRSYLVAGSADVTLAVQDVTGLSYVDFTSKITTAFDAYEIVPIDVMPTTNGTHIWLRGSNDNGSTFLTSGYSYSGEYIDAADSRQYHIATAQAQIVLSGESVKNSGSVTGAVGLSGKITLFRPAHNRYVTVGIETHHRADSDSLSPLRATGQLNMGASQVMNASRVMPASGTFASGTIKLIGKRKAVA